jgi:RHS repeat-associated protein
VTTVFVYDAMGELAAEYSNTANTSACLTCYLSYDHLGTTRLVTNASGQVVSRHDYLPFGEEIPSGVGGRDATWGSSTDFVNQKFTGKEWDSESGLDYFGARYYGNALGRFTSADPLGMNILRVLNPQRWNMYAYAVNNSLAYLDPDGRDAIAVKFGNGAHGLGHAGIASVHHDGKGTFADFAPQTKDSPQGPGKYSFSDISVSYGPDGKPTKESLVQLANQLADTEGQPHDSVSVAYFKTSDAETASLDAYLTNAFNLQQQGTQPTYWVGFRDCISFCMNGMQKAGVGQGSSVLTVPNLQYLYFRLSADQTATGTPPQKKKEKVTSKICFIDENGKLVC